MGTPRYCPNCGWSEKAVRSKERLLYGTLTFLIGVPALLIGGCMCQFGLSGDWSRSGIPGGQDPPSTYVVYGLVGFGIFAATLWPYVRSLRR